jgi:ABC-2 type transport system ATP-binding protein
MPAILTDQLTKRFGSFTAVDNVRLNINDGEIYALVGPNGAGKTTLVKMMVGILSPTRGTVKIAGFDICRSPLTARKNFGYVPDDPSGYDYLSGMEFLIFTGRLRGIEKGKLERRIKELVRLFPITDVIYRPMGDYSRGNKQKLAVLAAIISEPQVLFIDEPVVGLDPPSIRILGRILTEYAGNGKTVFFVTHILDFARDFAHRTGVMKEGKIVEEIQLTKKVDLNELL